MDQIQYVGEHPIFGLIGHGLIIAAFVSALLATFPIYGHISIARMQQLPINGNN